MKLPISTPHQPIYKQVWLLGLEQMFKMPLPSMFIVINQHNCNLFHNIVEAHCNAVDNSGLILMSIYVANTINAN